MPGPIASHRASHGKLRGGRSDAAPSRPRRTPPACLTGRLHAARETRFGPRAPSIEEAVASLSALWGETIRSCGASAANILGLTTQNSGAVRLSHIGSQPPVALRCAGSALAPCVAQATRGAVPTSRRRGSRPGMVRPPGGRGRPRDGCLPALRRHGRAGGGARDHADAVHAKPTCCPFRFRDSLIAVSCCTKLIPWRGLGDAARPRA